MDFTQVPIGFGLALAANEMAMSAYSTMSEQQKREVLNKAHQVQSKAEMQRLVDDLGKDFLKMS